MRPAPPSSRRRRTTSKQLPCLSFLPAPHAAGAALRSAQTDDQQAAALPVFPSRRALGEYAAQSSGDVAKSAALTGAFTKSLEAFDFSLLTAERAQEAAGEQSRELLEATITALDRCAGSRPGEQPARDASAPPGGPLAPCSLPAPDCRRSLLSTVPEADMQRALEVVRGVAEQEPESQGEVDERQLAELRNLL